MIASVIKNLVREHPEQRLEDASTLALILVGESRSKG